MSQDLISHLVSMRAAIRDGDWSGGLGHLLSGWQGIADNGFFDGPLLYALLAEGFLAAPDSPSECLLLASARQQRQMTNTLQRQLRHVSRLCKLSQTVFNPEQHPENDWWFRSLRLRAETIRVYWSADQNSEALSKRFSVLLRMYRELWKTNVWSPVPNVPQGRPAAWRQFPRNVRLAKALDDIVQQSSVRWLDPAAAFLCNTLLMLVNPDGDVGPEKRRQDDGTGATWILIAVDDLFKRNPTPAGLVLGLKIEVIPDGCGCFYPHPSRAAHVIPSDSFQSGLRNAWSVVLGRGLDGHSSRRFDYRWSLTVIDDSSESTLLHRRRRLLLRSRLDGRSGEVAAACALRSAVNSEPLDLSRAVTATFAGELPNADNPRIEPVMDVHLKALGIKAVQQELKPVDDLHHRMARQILQIDHLVLANGQEIPAPLPPGLSRVKKIDFETAFGELSDDAIATQTVKRKLLAQAKLFFQEECFADSNSQSSEDLLKYYFLNPMTRPSEKDDPTEAHGPTLDAVAKKAIDLTDDERNAVVQGRLRAEPNVDAFGHRIRPMLLVADSGMGKTTLLRRIELEVAAESGPRLPVFLDVLSDYLRHDSREEFLKEICKSHRTLFPDFGETEEEKKLQRRHAWLERKVRRGEVVFLLDALDQTSAHWENLHLLVRDLPECPLLLTLRPDALSTRSQAIGKEDRWDHVDVRPLRPRDARIYLGEHARLFFQKIESIDLNLTWQFWNGDEQNRVFNEEALDNAVDRDSVLTIPLILHLLREFAQQNRIAIDPDDVTLAELKNRYSIYEMVICGDRGLIATGIEKLKDQKVEIHRIFSNHQETIDVMSQAALWQLRQHHFEKELNGAQQQKFLQIVQQVADGQPLKADLEPAMKQLNLVTVNSMFESRGGIAWRHRSFFEFLGGRRLAELLASENPREQQESRDLLFDIHNVLNKDGSIRMFSVNENGRRTSQFRDLPSDWHWALRFALSHAEAVTREGAEQLTTELLAVGNPWIVAEAIKHDGLDLSNDQDGLIRWLVHRVYEHSDILQNGNRDHAVDAVQRLEYSLEDESPTEANIAGSVVAASRPVEPRRLSQLLLSRSTRNAAYLHPLRELLPNPATVYASISADASLKDRLTRLHSREATWNFLESFVTLRGGTFDLSGYKEHRQIKPQKQQIKSFRLADFPVTNETFELFCPTHRRQRDQYNNADDQPVLYVNWFMAKEFCAWLSTLTGQNYRLPTEWEWEWACRWYDTRKERYWWGPSMNDQLCLYAGYNGDDKRETNLGRTRSRGDAIKAFTEAKTWHPSHTLSCLGLLDMSGNVWEWCQSRYDESDDTPGSSRVLRGGSWRNYFADDCRSSGRIRSTPDGRDSRTGFRLCME